MTSGIDWKEPFNGPLESFFAMSAAATGSNSSSTAPWPAQPGTEFNYNSGNSHLLSAILTKVTGRSALDYAREKLFGPLGIEDVLWRHDPQGISAGGAGLYLQPRDMAKIGYALPARRPVGGKADPAGVVDRGRAPGQCRHARDLGIGASLRQPVLGHAGPRRLFRGRLSPPAHRRGAEARHRGGRDRCCALPAAGRQAVRAELRLRYAVGLPGRRRDFRQGRSLQFRCNGPSRGTPAVGHHRTAVAGRRAIGDGQGRLRQDLALCQAMRCASSRSPSGSTTPFILRIRARA